MLALASLQDAVLLLRAIPGAALRLPLATFSHPFGMPTVAPPDAPKRTIITPRGRKSAEFQPEPDRPARYPRNNPIPIRSFPDLNPPRPAESDAKQPERRMRHLDQKLLLDISHRVRMRQKQELRQSRRAAGKPLPPNAKPVDRCERTIQIAPVRLPARQKIGAAEPRHPSG